MFFINKQDIREYNLKKVREIFKSGLSYTRLEIAEICELSNVTMGSLFRILLDNNEIIEDGVKQSDGGRPSIMYHYNARYKLVLTIYMFENNNQDYAYYSVVDMLGNIIYSYNELMKNINLDSYNLTIEKILKEYPNISAIGFGMPGEEFNGRLIISDYENLRNINFAQHIENIFQIPVVIENDINSAIIGYCSNHDIPSNECSIGLYFPSKYPPGAGIIVNGRLHKGRDGLAGEIKYLPIWNNGYPIDWNTFDFSNNDDFIEMITRITIAFNSMYNPHRIVVYGDRVPKNLSQIVYNRCVSDVEKITYPKIVLKKEFEKDFSFGINTITLNFLSKTGF